jgi:hypothetical protein
VPRPLPTTLVLLLLAGSAVAFAVTEGLKLQKRPITPIEITKVFSPVCRCSAGARRRRLQAAQARHDHAVDRRRAR